MSKIQKETLEAMIKAEGKKTPIEFLLDVMHNPNNNPMLRIEAARTAAPYVHKKMPTAIEHSGEIEFIPPYIPSKRELKEMDPDFKSKDDLEDL